MLLSDAINAYGLDRRAKGFAPKTRQGEQHILRLFLADVGNIQVRQLKPTHADIFWSQRSAWSAGTINRARHTLSTFFAWCRARGYMNASTDPLAGMKAIKVPQRSRVIIPQARFEEVIANRRTPRARIAFALGLYLFVRISETQMLRWQDINLEDSTAEVFRKKTSTIDILPICDELAEELRRWRLEYASKMGEQVRPEWYVVPALTPSRGVAAKGRKGWVAHHPRYYLPTKQSDLAKVIKAGLEQEGYYVPHEGGHTLRRSGATALYNQLSSVGHDRAIRVCQAMLGHNSVQTTEVYLRLDLDRKVRNDLLAGKPMFPVRDGGDVVPMIGSIDGEEDSRVV